MAKLPSFTVLCDNNEKKPWIFDPEPKVAGKVQLIGTEIQSLETGDYTIKELAESKILCIERKAGFGELFGNYAFKENRERFEREMDRASKFVHKYLIIETSLNDDLFTLGVPQMRFPIPGKKLVDWVFELQLKYGVIPVFAGSCGQKTAKIIMKKIAREYIGV